MRTWWIYRLLAVLLTGVAAVGAVLLPVDPGRVRRTAAQDLPAPPASPSPEVQPDVAPPGCQNDPAGLPVPLGPEGRPANYLHTRGARIYDAQCREVRIFGVNWPGMESSDHAPGGLGVRNWQDLLDQVAALGYNTLRIPLSNETLEPGRQIANVNFTRNHDLQGLTGLEMLDRLVAGARERGLKVILDRHQPTSSGRTGLWYTREVPEARWIADWQMLAARYAGNDTVIGVDLHNEPRGEATWGIGDPATDWRLAAERAGNAVLEVNPFLLIFVEGIETVGLDHSWWGGNLLGVRAAPIRLNVPNRVVYSPHEYGPAVSWQPWFQDPRFPENLRAEWDRHWGYIQREGLAPVVVGEFGGRSFGDDLDGQWQRALLTYLQDQGIGALVWALNPGWDTGGVLTGDLQSVDWARQEGYQELFAAPIDPGLSGVFGQVQTRLRVAIRPREPGGSREVGFTVQIVNDGPTLLDLTRVELRYWLSAGGPLAPEPKLEVESGELPGACMQTEFVSTDQDGQDRYLRLRFTPGSGALGGYQASGRLTVRMQKPDPAASSQPNDGTHTETPAPGDHVALYLDGELVWGQEP